MSNSVPGKPDSRLLPPSASGAFSEDAPISPLTTRLKLWSRLGAAVILTSATAGCAEGEGEGEGRGEGTAQSVGEGEGSAEAALLQTDDVAYLTQLGLIRGHLRVGSELYDQDLPKLAELHMKHPRAEIYATLTAAFTSRGCAGFPNELTQLANAVSAGAAKAEVAEHYQTLLAAITRCEQTGTNITPAVAAKVVENLLRTAGVEYQIGVINGAINNLHEYQDAWGFTRIASEWARSTAFATGATAPAVASQLQNTIESLDPLWPSLDPDSPPGQSAAQLFGAAGRVEIAALALAGS